MTRTERLTLPSLRSPPTSITPCKQPQCLTCQLHLNCSPTVTSNHPHHRNTYSICHSFSCSSTNIVYLITYTKCREQYVGCTITQLNTRINHHHTCKTYIHKHFNLPDQSITNLTIQPLDTPTNTHNTQELYEVEQYWIVTLHTLNPYGLYSSPGNHIT